MLTNKKSLLFLFMVAFSTFSQTWKDDSLVVRQILDTNGLDYVTVYDAVTKDSTGRVIKITIAHLPSFHILPASIKQLDILRELSIIGTDLAIIPAEIGLLNNLSVLDLGYNKLTFIPPEIGNLKILRSLSLNNNNLTTIPAEIGALKNILLLGLCYNTLTSLPPEIGLLGSLMYLIVNNNEITSFPPEIGKCKNLTQLSAENNKITRLPDEICNIDSLKSIGAKNNLISYIPENIGKIPAFRGINLFNNKLKHVPNSLIPFGLGNVGMCYNDSLVFTPEQKAAWHVTDYQSYFYPYCASGILDYSNISKTKPLTTRMRITGQNIILLVDRPEKVSCRVYDVCGKLVQTLLNQATMEAGTHTILLNRALYSSGVYMLRYTTGAGGLFSKAVVAGSYSD